MNRINRYVTITLSALLGTSLALSTSYAQQLVETANGAVEGAYDLSTGIRTFLGIPFAASPVGDTRWRPPQPAEDWEGVRKALAFGPRCMQRPIFDDMVFRSDGMSEDCLYLNVWTPAVEDDELLPVLVYFYGGGFAAGDGSEGRYDGESMARKGIVAVTVNYRLGMFGFFAHPELTKESTHQASGNYGLLDQHAALVWVQQNISAFGGDPARVTIAGESAGSVSVSAHMASPVSKGLFAHAIGESGSIMGTLSAVPLAEAEANGEKLASILLPGATGSLPLLRAIPADSLLDATARPGLPWLSPTIDGFFLPKAPTEIFAAGEHTRVPLLAGVNSEEMGYFGVLGRAAPTVENYRKALTRLYPDHAEQVFEFYPASTEAEVMDAAQDLASDRFISYSTWKWIDLATKTGGQPTYYYLYAHPRPPMRRAAGNMGPPRPRGAVHSAEIEYALGNLDRNTVFDWTPDDYKVSRLMQEYFANFIKTGNPNGPRLPEWPTFSTGKRLVIDVNPRSEDTDQLRARYELLDRLARP